MNFIHCMNINLISQGCLFGISGATPQSFFLHCQFIRFKFVLWHFLKNKIYIMAVYKEVGNIWSQQDMEYGIRAWHKMCFSLYIPANQKSAL